jgi:DhnA family fructose-bisphosphate aldolase class Ia
MLGKKIRMERVMDRNTMKTVMVPLIHGVMEANAYGVSLGRNIFQYKKPGNMIKAVSQIVHKGFDVSSAMEVLKEEPIESSIFSGTVIW